MGIRIVPVILVLLTVAAPARAQETLDRLFGQPVVAVRFELEGREVQTSLQSLVDVRANDPLRPEAVRESIAHLVNAGRFEDVQVFATARPGGVDVLFRLTPTHPIDRLEFAGTDLGLSKPELEQLIRDRFGGIPVRQPPESVARALEGMLDDEGFPEAKVTPRVSPTHNPDRATLVLTIEAGRRLMITRTDVVGTSPLTSDAIIARTHSAPGQPFRRHALEAELAAIGDELHRQGFYTAIAVLQQAPEPGTTVDSEGVNLTVRVDAGPRVTLRWAGPKPRGAEEDFVPIRRQASADPDLLEDADQRIARYWRQQGYRDVKVTHASERQDDTLVITMQTEVGLRYRVRDVAITGVAHVPEDLVRRTLRLAPGEWYDQARLANGLVQLRLLYSRAGYYQAKAQELPVEEIASARTATEVPVTVHVDVAEGPMLTIGSLRFDGVRPDLEAAFRERMRLRAGGPYVVEYVRRDQLEVDQYYHDHAFENETSQVETTPHPETGTVDVSFKVTEGPQITVADIRVVGNDKVDDKTVRQAMTLREGVPFGEAERLESQTQLYNLGTFRRASIDEEPRLPGEETAHVIVTVEELPPNIWNFGGGVEAERRVRKLEDGTLSDRFVAAPRGFIELGRRNIGGKNRAVDFFARLALRPADVPGKNFGFAEYRVAGTYFEPRAFNSETNVTAGASSEQASRTDFNFLRKTVSFDAVRRLSSRVGASGRYSLEFTRIFDSKIADADKPIIDRFLPQVRLSIVSGGVLWDRRNDPLVPVRGTLMTADYEVAARALGSEVGYGKVFLQSSVFRSLPTTRRLVVGLRGEVGLAHGFERQIETPEGSVVTLTDIPASQRFFAGGGTTVRGFQSDRLGVPEIVNKDGLSLGGNGLVVLNAELRATIGKLKGRDFGVVGFTDAGNVFARTSDIDLSRIRGTYGFGVRYDSPIGPLRLDFGFKMDRHLINGQRERLWEYHLNIGEAF